MTAVTVLYLDHTAKMGGGEIALLNLLRTLDLVRYHPLVVLASDGPLVARLRAVGIETLVLPLDPAVVETRKDRLGPASLLRLRSVLATLRYAFRLAALIRKRRVALIHTNSLKADLYGGLAGRLAGVPVIWHVRDHVDGHYLPAPVAAMFRWLSQWVPQMVVANSESTLLRLHPHSGQPAAVVYSGVQGLSPNDRVCVVHDGTDGRAAANGGNASRISGPPVVTLVGRITPWKGQHIFIKAAAVVLRRFPEVRFQIVGAALFGEDDYEKSLHVLAASFGIAEQVAFLGFQDDVGAILAKTDVVVHASTLGEPFGQVVIEGMAAGKPVVATAGGALPEIVEHGETGLLVPMGDAGAMAEAIGMLLADPGRAHELGEAGRRRVVSRFTIEQTARKVEAVYTVLLKPHGLQGD